MSVYHYKRMCIGLFEQVFSLVYLVACVYGNKYSSYLCCCPECYVPCRNIGRPYSNVVASFYTHCDKRTCECVNIITELRICSCIVKLCIAESVLLRESFTDTVKNVRKSIVDKTFLWPRIIAVFAEIFLNDVLMFYAVRLHKVSKLWENDTCICKIFCPAFCPFK